jgi:hypothetical protein
MKKNVLLFASALVSAFAFASEPGEGSTPTGLVVIKKNATTFNVLYQPASLSNVNVSILDEQGNKVFSESIRKTEGFNRPYNFEELKEGEYTIVVEDASGIQKKSLVYGHDLVVKAANVLKLRDDRYLVTIKGAQVTGKVSIKVYEGGKLLHQQASDITGDFGRLYTLKNVSAAISFEVSDSKGNIIN